MINLSGTPCHKSNAWNTTITSCLKGERNGTVSLLSTSYGSQSTFDSFSGNYGLVSYRDPNLNETLDVYDQIAGYLENLDLSDKELTKILIGCVGHLDPPLTPDRKGTVAMVELLTGRTHELKQKRRDELLSTKRGDIQSYASLFSKIRKSGNVCVLGNEEKIKKSGKRFDHLVKVFS